MCDKKWLILLDLDDTLMPTNYRYHEAAWRCGLIIQKALAGRSRRPSEVLALQQAIDRSLFKDMGFLIKRYPLSWVTTYERLAAEAGMPVNPKVSKRLANTAGYFKYGPFRAFAGAKTVLRKLIKQGHFLHLVTAGEPDLQWRKIEQAGLTRYFDNGNFHVVPMEKKSTFIKLVESTDRPAMMVGDSKRNDIRPAQEIGLTTVWIPSETRNDSDSEVEPDWEIGHIKLLPDLIFRIEPKEKK